MSTCVYTHIQSQHNKGRESERASDTDAPQDRKQDAVRDNGKKDGFISHLLGHRLVFSVRISQPRCLLIPWLAYS